MKFIQFGCWNEYSCDKNMPERNPVSMVMNKLNSMAPNVDFIIVSGDNYYPGKDVQKIKAGETYNGVVLKEDIKIKKKKIDRNDIVSGFNCLPSSVEVNIILGNHDLVSQKDNVYKLEDGEYEPEGACTILKTEQSISTTNNLNLSYYMSKYDDSTKTLIIMMDTSMYSTDDVSEFLSCYKYLIDREDSLSDDEYIQKIRQTQYEKIVADLTRHSGEIKNLIISGHHPISGYKLKLGENKDKFVILGDDLEPFINVLTSIYSKIGGDAVNYYYLCADLHMYQQGTVKLQVDDINQMTINQYIVGTGGTTLDPNPFSEEYKAIKKNRLDVINVPIISGKHRFIMSDEDISISNANYGHGFILCEIGDVPQFSFVLIKTVSGGRKTKRRRRRHTTKRRRTIKRRKYSGKR